LSAEERTRVAVAGAGGMGREALAWLRDAHPDAEPVAFYTLPGAVRPSGADVDLPLVDSLAALHGLGVTASVVAIGDGQRRESVAEELKGAGIDLFSVVHPTASLGPGVRIGQGVILAPGCVLTRDIGVGRGAIVNYRAAIGHDCTVGSHALIGPGAVLTGAVRIGSRALIGAGAVILPGCIVGDDATVGAGAVVTRDVALGSVVVGNPARSSGPRGESQ
jgi:sugar O-acyltransferase (sialic acid O-acetyltransferase NeuD family)